MKRSFIILMAASALAAVSCTKEVNDQTASEKEQVTMSFDATIGAPTKVELGAANGEGGYKVLWSKDDNIKVFANGASTFDGVEFTTDIEEASATATFTGTIDADDTYYAFYPSTTNAKWYGSSSRFGVTLSANQKANGIASGFAYAKAEGTSLQFKHLTGFVKFTIPAEYDGKIVKVAFSGNGDSPAPLAGYQYIYPDNLLTNSFPHSDNKFAEISLSPASGDAFAAGTYYIVSFPAQLGDGVTMTFTNTEGATATKTASKPAEIKAGDILNLGTINGLTYEAAFKHSLPLKDDFSAENVLENYEVVGSVTVETANLSAGGESPELLMRGGSSLTANIDLDGFSGNLTMSFNTNQRARLTVSSSVQNVVITDLSTEGNTYHLTVAVPEGLEELPITIKNNTSGDNARLDNLLVTKNTIQKISFNQSSYMFAIGSSEVTQFTGQSPIGAKTPVTYASDNEAVATVNPSTGEVTLGNTVGIAVITAVAAETEDYREASASYSIELISASTEKKEYTLTITTDNFNTTSYAANNNVKTTKAVASDDSEFDVQWESYQVMLQNSVIQWQKNKGYIYNKTNLGEIKSVTITSASGTFTKTIGSSEKPSTNGTGGFFMIKIGNATGKASKITVVFER